MDADPDEVRRYFEGLPLSALSKKDSNRLEADIRPEEVISAISWLPLGKAPGLDGFTPAFY